MLQIQHILYPTDFSPCAKAALPHALHLARKHGATLHLLYAAPVFGEDPLRGVFQASVDEQDFYRHLRDEADVQMKALIRSEEADGMPVKRVHTRGIAPAAALLDYAAASDIDLIVMGTHGRRGLRRMLLGSVTAEVVRKSTCPVLTVRACEERHEAPFEVRRLLVPLDFSTFSEEAFQYASELALLYGAALDVVHVLDVASHPELYVVPLKERERFRTKLQADVRARLEQFVEKAGAPALEVSIHVVMGAAPEQIVDFASENAVDLIVIASHGRTGLDRFMLGSVAERVVREAPCPVFVTKPFGTSLLEAQEAGTVEDAALLGG